MNIDNLICVTLKCDNKNTLNLLHLLHQLRYGNQSINGVSNRSFFKHNIISGYIFTSHIEYPESHLVLKIFVFLKKKTPILVTNLKRRFQKLLNKTDINYETINNCHHEKFLPFLVQMETTHQTIYGVKRLKKIKKTCLI